MNKEEVIKVLREHNNWRRGAEGSMEEPKILGEAIDEAIEMLTQSHTLQTCTVTATKKQLYSAGCDELLTGQKVDYVKDWPTGYSQIKVKQEFLSKLSGKNMFAFYDLPKEWLKF